MAGTAVALRQSILSAASHRSVADSWSMVAAMTTSKQRDVLHRLSTEAR